MLFSFGGGEGCCQVPKKHDLIFPDDQDADRGRGLLHCLLAALQHILGAATLIFFIVFPHLFEYYVSASKIRSWAS